MCPAWVPTAVFYEIYPQTFCDSNGDGIGDLPGIIRKLDYVKSLGVDAIWLNPCYVSPFRDAGYDVADFYRVDPRYGTNADMKRLLSRAHRLGLRVILDFVPGHTSVDHPWFRASCDPAPNRFSNWYVWTDNSWASAGSEFAGKMIHGYANRNGNFLVNFFWSQPALNWGFAKPDPKRPWQLGVNHPDVRALREEMKNVLRFWLDMGADGFRVDMAGSLVKNDGNGGENVRLWREIRRMFDRDYPEAFLVSEWSAPRHALAGGFHADFMHWFREYGDLFRKESWRSLNGLSSGHSFFDRAGRGDISRFLRAYLSEYRATRDKGFISVPVGNHDLSRIRIDRSEREVELIYAFHLTMPGVPFIYYGDEIGMRHLDGVQATEGAYRPRSGARTPMQWTRGRNAGFSTAAQSKLYLPVDAGKDAPCVADQELRPSSLLNRIRLLVRLRTQEPALAAHAGFSPLFAKPDAYPFVYQRDGGARPIVVALNPSARKVTVSLGVPASTVRPELLAGFGASLTGRGRKALIRMEGCSYGVWRT